MNHKILLSAKELHELCVEGQCIIVDCRFDLSEPSAGMRQYGEGHIPGSFYAHLDNDLSGPIELHTGRHPLPEDDAFARFLSSIGWRNGKMLVAYDEGSSAFAVRLWWLMRYFDHPAAVLDGGLAAWKRAGYNLETLPQVSEQSPIPDLFPNKTKALSTSRISDGLDSLTLIDARATERFTGENEPLDEKGGHIPGALNRPFMQNLAGDGRFKRPELLQSEFKELLTGVRLQDVVHYCGSGVTACHNLFAMEWAGLKGTRLYPGSWSRWIRDSDRPIETGPTQS